jgi:hypothetical protein
LLLCRGVGLAGSYSSWLASIASSSAGAARQLAFGHRTAVIAAVSLAEPEPPRLSFRLIDQVLSVR